MAAWIPERVVDPALAGTLIAEQFAHLGALPLRLLGAGWDSTVYLLGDEWVFRFPRREIVLPGLETEIRALPLLAPLLPFGLPVPEHVGRPTEAFPWPFAGSRLVPGHEAVGLTETQRHALARPLGDALRKLHAPETLHLAGDLLPENFTRRADMQLRVPLAETVLAEVDSLWIRPPVVDDVLDSAKVLPQPEPSAVCHGDLHFRHVLVDDGRLSGLIDWIDLCRGDPALDLQVYWSFFAPESRDAFLDAYGGSASETLLRARVIALFLNASLLAYASHEQHPAIEREALASLRRAAT